MLMATDTQTLKSGVQSLLDGASIEITPKTLKPLRENRSLLPEGSRVYIAFMPDQDVAEMVETTRELLAFGFRPVPHFPARTMTSASMFEDYSRAVAGDGLAKDVLVIGGGVDKPVGPYHESMQLIEQGLFESLGVTSIAVAGHPEGHTDVSDDLLTKAIADKNAYAAANDVDMLFATQFCMEGEPILDWDKRLRAMDNTLPVHLGLPGPATLKSLLFFAKLCGIGNSMRVLRKQALKLAKMLNVNLPDELMTQLAAYNIAHDDSFIKTAHFYPFGGVGRTLRFMAMIREGDFTMNTKNTGFKLDRALD